MWLQETIVGALRRLGLLPLYDGCRFRLVLLTQGRARRAFNRAFPDCPVPPAALSYDAYAHIRSHEYLDTGRRHAKIISDLINEHAASGDLNILEWGCGPARVIRHLPEFLARPARLTGADYNPDSIAWCRANIRGVEFIQNWLEPPLALDAGRLDVVYALSVFTHLSEKLHTAWRDELLRVLKPGGLLILTLHGDRFRNRHLNAEERNAYDRGQLVIRGGVSVGKKWYGAFHPPAFAKEHLLRGFEILKHQPGPIADGFDQDLWVARKRS